MRNAMCWSRRKSQEKTEGEGKKEREKNVRLGWLGKVWGQGNNWVVVPVY